ncbi:MAG: pentapeptide repeat-containing protein [Gammaproteobacteria bacterium]|nr:pentapeptide repeat-containing protein [Gammaproteobacteria bacterium]
MKNRKLPLILLLAACATSTVFADDRRGDDESNGYRDGIYNRLLALETQVQALTAEIFRHCSAEPQYGVDWHGCDKSGLDLSGADLMNSNLIGINLRGTNMTNAILYGANLDGADFTGADLSGAGMEGANVPNVIWSNTTCQDGSNSDVLGYCEISALYHPEL